MNINKIVNKFQGVKKKKKKSYQMRCPCHRR